MSEKDEMKRRFSEEQVVSILRKVKESGKVAQLCRKYGISRESY